MDNSKDELKSPRIERSSPRSGRSTTNSGRSLIKSRKFTAHRFAKYRKARGLLVRRMREKRGLSQKELGAMSQVRRFENGEIAQIELMELLARLVPCPRELLHFVKIVLVNLPVACVKCRETCAYKGVDAEALSKQHLGDITLHNFDD